MVAARAYRLSDGEMCVTSVLTMFLDADPN